MGRTQLRWAAATRRSRRRRARPVPWDPGDLLVCLALRAQLDLREPQESLESQEPLVPLALLDPLGPQDVLVKMVTPARLASPESVEVPVLRAHVASLATPG